jgi:hypothetical protein
MVEPVGNKVRNLSNEFQSKVLLLTGSADMVVSYTEE